MAEDFARVSLTAKLTACMRQYSDIPFATEVARFVQADEALDALLREQQICREDILWYAPLLEVRYKSIAEIIRKLGVKQVLELASGLSLRGLAMSRDAEMTYVETDLEGITQEKSRLIASLQQEHQILRPENNHLTVANALEAEQLGHAVRPFQPNQPIAVITEGLLQYLSSIELETVARNIHSLLKAFGGVWITPDFSIKTDAAPVSEQQKRFRSALADVTGRKLYSHAFENEAALQSFFKTVGLNAECRSQIETVPVLTSIARLDDTSRQIWENTKAGLKVWVLSAAA